MRIGGLNKNCRCFPCHAGMEDCTFCYCPFYPCLDESRGKFYVSEKTGESVWDCSGCLWIHRAKTVRLIYGFLKNNKNNIFSGS